MTWLGHLGAGLCLLAALALGCRSDESSSKQASNTATSTSAADGRLSVTGRLLIESSPSSSSDDAPQLASGALVYAELEPMAKIEATAAGTFRLEIDSQLLGSSNTGKPLITWGATVAREGAYYGIRQVDVPLTSADQAVELGDVVLQPAGSINLHVTDEDGLPLTGATFELPRTPFVTQTNSAGQGILLGVPASQWTIRISADGYDSQEAAVGLAEGEQHTLVTPVVLQPKAP